MAMGDDDESLDDGESGVSSNPGAGGNAGAGALTGIGGMLSASGAEFQGDANAGVAEYNSATAYQNASEVYAMGKEQARRSLIQSGKMIGAEGAAYGASGVTSDGSAQWVMRNSAAQGELNALTIMSNSTNKAIALNNEGALDQYRADNAQHAGDLGAFSALIGAGGSAASMAGGG